MTIFYVGFLFMVPQSYEGVGDLLIESYDEVVVWGKEKVAFNFTKDISDRSLAYENFVDDEEEEELKIN